MDSLSILSRLTPYTSNGAGSFDELREDI